MAKHKAIPVGTVVDFSAPWALERGVTTSERVFDEASGRWGYRILSKSRGKFFIYTSYVHVVNGR